jgi:hypothetical protein
MPMPLFVISLAVVATVYFVLSTYSLISRAETPTRADRLQSTRVLIWLIVAVGLWYLVALLPTSH